MERIVILNFGAQYNQLIARRVREAGVYSELLPPTSSIDTIVGSGLSGIILTGGPDSVYDDDARSCLNSIYTLGVPVLGICYGMQLMSSHFGAKVGPAPTREYGKTLTYFDDSPLFKGIPTSITWMSHNDSVLTCPEGFKIISHTDGCDICGIECADKKLFGVQFHPEVAHTEYCKTLFDNFVHGICGCVGEWSMDSLADELIEEIRNQVGDCRVVAGLSGGVDSSVAATLVHNAIGDRLTCIFVDHGLLRKNEAAEVMNYYRNEIGLNVIEVDAKDRFLSKLAGVSEPERKRKIIGEEFIRVFEEEAKKIGADYLLQGTIYPDVVESGMGGSAVIKSHHNVGGLPDDISFKGLVEPLRKLFKDEVRRLGESLGMPAPLVWRQPFPGPGLGVRIIGEITAEKVRILQDADFVLRDEMAKNGYERSLSQFFCVYTGSKSVGVMGDHRTYENVIAIRAVTTDDFMTADWARIPYDILATVSNRITNEVDGVNRIVYDITSKPPGTVEWE